MKAALFKRDPGVEIQTLWGSTLCHIDDVTFKEKKDIPHIFTKYRQETRQTKVRTLVPTPVKGQLPLP